MTEATSNAVVACSLDDLEDGKPIRVVVPFGPIAVVRWGSEVFAFPSICPHRAGPLWRGSALARLDAARPGTRLEADHATPVIQCPWHGWEFELRTGASIGGGPCSIRPIPCRVEGSDVLVTNPDPEDAER